MDEISEIIGRLKEAHGKGLRPAFVYDRISAEVQADGVSLEYQGAGAARYADGTGLFVVHSFQVVESASKEGRKVFNRMVDLARNFGVRNLIFKNTDRMSRNYQDLVRIDRLIDDEGFRIHFHQTGLMIHRESSYNDRFLIGIQLAVAKHLSDKLRQDIREHNVFKARKGVAPGRSPFGYRYDRKEKKHEIDPAAEKILHGIFDTFDNSEMSLDAFVRHLNDNSIKAPTGGRWHKGPLHKLLTKPFYHGEFTHRGEIRPGTHQPYYNIERYQKRLTRLDGAYRAARTRESDPGLSGLLHCDCGRSMTGIIKKRRYVYYVHNCSLSGRFEYMREAEALALIDAEIERVRYSPEFAENLKNLVHHVAENQKQDSNASLNALNVRITAMNEKKARLYDLYAEEGIDLPILRENLNTITEEIKKLEECRLSAHYDFDRITVEICNAIDHLCDAPLGVLGPDPFEKALRLRQLATSVTLTKDRARVQWLKPYSFLMTDPILAIRESGPHSFPERQKKRVTTRPVMCPGEDEVVTTAIKDLLLDWRLWLVQQAR